MKDPTKHHTFATYGELQEFCRANGYSYRKAGHEDDGLNNGTLIVHFGSHDAVTEVGGTWEVTGTPVTR